MNKWMRNAPSFIVIVVLLLQTPRVMEFGERIGAHFILALVFATFLSFSTFTLAYFQGKTRIYQVTADKEKDAKAYTAQKKMADLYTEVHGTATFWLVLFVMIEGLLNLAETMAELKGTVAMYDWEWFGAIVYGLFPTLAAYGMGNLQALIDRMPHGAAGASQLEKVFNAFMRRMENALDAPSENANASETHKTHDAKKVKRNADAYPKPCPHCGEMQASSNAYSTHIGRWCKQKPAIGFVPIPVNKAETTTTTSEVVQK